MIITHKLQLLNEKEVHLASKMLKVEMSVGMNIDGHVPDMMTRVRVLPSVATVGLAARVERMQGKGTVVDMYVKFLPVAGSIYFNLQRLCKMIKSLPDVQYIKITKLGGRPIIYQGKPIVF